MRLGPSYNTNNYPTSVSVAFSALVTDASTVTHTLARRAPTFPEPKPYGSQDARVPRSSATRPPASTAAPTSRMLPIGAGSPARLSDTAPLVTGAISHALPLPGAAEKRRVTGI